MMHPVIRGGLEADLARDLPEDSAMIQPTIRPGFTEIPLRLSLPDPDPNEEIPDYHDLRLEVEVVPLTRLDDREIVMAEISIRLCVTDEAYRMIGTPQTIGAGYGLRYMVRIP